MDYLLYLDLLALVLSQHIEVLCLHLLVVSNQLLCPLLCFLVLRELVHEDLVVESEFLGGFRLSEHLPLRHGLHLLVQFVIAPASLLHL